MNMRLEHYKVFVTVSKCGSFSVAAKELFVTQSAVSQQIKQLEDSLKSKLFIRSRSGIKLTPHGEMLFEYAEKAMSLLDTAENKFNNISHLEEGELNIGSSDTITKHYLMPVLERFHDSYPNIKVKIINRVTVESLEILKNGSVELAFVNLPLPPSLSDNSIIVTEALKLHDIFVAGEKYSHLKDTVLKLDQIAELPLIMLESKSNTRSRINDYFLSQGIVLNPEIELGSHDLLLDFALSNFGIAVVISEFSRKYTESGQLFEIKIEKPVPERSVGVCTLKGVSISASSNIFLDMLYKNYE